MRDIRVRTRDTAGHVDGDRASALGADIAIAEADRAAAVWTVDCVAAGRQSIRRTGDRHPGWQSISEIGAVDWFVVLAVVDDEGQFADAAGTDGIRSEKLAEMRCWDDCQSVAGRAAISQRGGQVTRDVLVRPCRVTYDIDGADGFGPNRSARIRDDACPRRRRQRTAGACRRGIRRSRDDNPGRSHSSELLSAEFNLRRQVSDCFALLAGFRYFELDEHFHADFVDGGAPPTYDTFTRNRLYGAQVGTEVSLCSSDRLTLDGFAEFGICHDSGYQTSILDTGIATLIAADGSDRAAFMGELAVTGNYSLTDCLSLEATYSLLWLETVVLATDQVPVTNFFTGAGIDGGGGEFYHGLLIGLVLRR